MVAAITLTPNTDVVGATITIDGTGFTATEDITLTYGGNPLTPVAPISTDGAGAFSGTFIVPASVQGVHSVVATDETLLTDDDNFTVITNLVITEANIAVGGTINATGTGFAASEAISFTFNSVGISAVEDPVSSDTDGSFTCSFVVPEVPNGSRTLVATDVTLNTDSDTVTVDALLVITEANITVGGTINFTGTGFTASEVIDFTFGGTAIVVEEDPLSSDANGSFTGSYIVEANPNGSTDLVATDQSAVTDTDSVIIDALLVITEANAQVGDTINLTGSGFTASEVIDFTFGGVACVVEEDPLSSDADGSFVATFVVTSIIKGSQDIVATDQSAVTDTDSITIIPLITLDDSSGVHGDSIVITGEGFANAEAITITFDGDEIVPDEDPVSSGADGSFTATITVPTGFDGNVSVVATDETAGTDSATYTVLLISSTEITINSSFDHLNGGSLNIQSVGTGDSVERGAVVDVPFSAADKYSTGGVRVDFSGVQGFTQVYLCKIIHNPVGLTCSFIPGASNDSSLGKIKFWGADGNELPDNDTTIASKTLTVEIRGI